MRVPGRPSLLAETRSRSVRVTLLGASLHKSRGTCPHFVNLSACKEECTDAVELRVLRGDLIRPNAYRLHPPEHAVWVDGPG